MEWKVLEVKERIVEQRQRVRRLGGAGRGGRSGRRSRGEGGSSMWSGDIGAVDVEQRGEAGMGEARLEPVQYTR